MPLTIVNGDITKRKVDAIVNAANRSLMGGGGVDGAIHRAAGPELLAECRMLHGCETGSAKLTRGYRLPCRYVIHAVGPVWRGGGHGEALTIAAEHACRSVAFPLISAGVYGSPKEEALTIAVDTIRDFLRGRPMDVSLVLFDEEAYRLAARLYPDILLG